MAAVNAGKNSPPLRSNSIRLPGVKRIMKDVELAALAWYLERRRQRRVVGHAAVGKRVMDAGIDDVEAARIDPVESKHRKDRRERARGAALHFLEDFVDTELIRQSAVGLAAPVVEVA